jgi:hypothetical protein
VVVDGSIEGAERAAQLPDVAAQLVRIKVDVLVVYTHER